MAHQRGQHLFQLQEQPFAGRIVVRKHMERSPITSYISHLTSYILRQQCCRRDGDGLMACREHGPTVAATFGDEERFARLQEVQHGQVVDGALGSLWKPKSRRSTLHQIAVLNAHQPSLTVVVWRLQPRHPLLVLPRRIARSDWRRKKDPSLPPLQGRSYPSSPYRGMRGGLRLLATGRHPGTAYSDIASQGRWGRPRRHTRSSGRCSGSP